MPVPDMDWTHAATAVPGWLAALAAWWDGRRRSRREDDHSAIEDMRLVTATLREEVERSKAERAELRRETDELRRENSELRRQVKDLREEVEVMAALLNKNGAYLRATSGP
jgi:predicted RNase H-like nuclease (RuvC/YqgF family)